MEGNPWVQIARLEEQVRSLDRVLQEREKQVVSALSAVQIATTKAEDAQHKVNLSQNEFRGALRDQNATFATRSELDAVKDRIQALERALAAAGGVKTGGQPLNAIWMLVLAAAISALVGYLMRSAP